MVRRLLVVVLFGVSACGGSSESSKNIALKFNAKLRNQEFSCNTTYSDIGTTNSTITPKDLRFFVSNINLIDDQGNRYPLDLNEDGVYQYQDVALVDLENGEAACSGEGNASLHSTISGSAEDKNYVGVAFTVGVPFLLNHSDTVDSEAPLNNTAMAWNWNGGRKFFKFDFSSNGMPTGYNIHLGSTGCTGNEVGAINVCSSPNRVPVELTNFNPDSNTIVLDLEALLANLNVDFNTDKTAPGCMSGPTDPECRNIFPKFGLGIQEIPASGQKIFFVE